MNRVLLVGNDRITIEELASALTDAGFAVEPAYSGSEALDAIDRAPVACLVTELRLEPGPGGLDVARYARAHRPDVRVVLLSGGAPPAADHPSHFIAKPFRPEEVVTALRAAIAA